MQNNMVSLRKRRTCAIAYSHGGAVSSFTGPSYLPRNYVAFRLDTAYSRSLPRYALCTLAYSLNSDSSRSI